MKIHSLEELFLTSLQYVYDAEKQLTEALPKMAAASATPQLRDAFDSHLKETRQHVLRVEQIFKIFAQKPSTKPNTVVEAMTEEAEGMMKIIESGPIRDAALIIAANQVEHFEMASYLSLKALAHSLDKPEALGLIEQNLSEEKNAAAKVTEVGEKYVNAQAAHCAVAAN